MNEQRDDGARLSVVVSMLGAKDKSYYFTSLSEREKALSIIAWTLLLKLSEVISSSVS